jgi:phosphoribosylformylglycinamidine synthase
MDCSVHCRVFATIFRSFPHEIHATIGGMKARVLVVPKPSVLDPQGQAIQRALHATGHTTVQSVRQGKVFEIELDALDRVAAEAELNLLAHEVLANSVIETYTVELLD